MVIRRVSPLSCAKIAGLLYAILGFVAGAVFSLVALVGSAFAPEGADGAAAFGALFGIGAIVLLPIFYGVCGFLGAALMAWLYNVLAGIVGGMEVEVQ